MLKVYRDVEFYKEVEIEISAEDISRCFDTSPVEESINGYLMLINDCAKVLNSVPDSVVSELSDSQHTVIRDFLSKAATRFNKVKGAPQEKAEESQAHRTTDQGQK